MAKTGTIRGRIIRIVDEHTVLVNLGSKDGVSSGGIFRTVGKSEAIIDPVTDEKLGSVEIVKTKLKASKVYERFSVAVSRWAELTASLTAVENALSMFSTIDTTVGKNLRVDPEEIVGWAASDEQIIRVGDEVEVEVEIIVEEDDEETTPPEPAEVTD